MSTYEKDSKIKRLFEAARREDGKRVPSFQAVLAGLKAEERTPGHVPVWGLRVAWIFALLLLVLIPAALMIRNDREAVSDRVATLELSDWELPTDFLLAYADDTLLTGVPELELDLESWVEPAEGIEK